MTTPSAARDLAPDVLRGFAPLGIVLVNVAYFATDPLLGATGEWLRGAGNTVAALLVWTLAQGKFYLLFSLLFGYSSQYLVKGDPANRPHWIARALALLVLRVGGPLAPRRLMTWGFGLGLPIQALTAWAAIANELGAAYSETLAVGAIALNLTAAPLLSAGYVGAILHLLEWRPAWIAWMRYAGQMSLTTYLLQSAVLATIFGPWGLGLFQRLDYGVAVLVAAATYLALAGLARLVLGRFRQGPLEWVMSSWTKAWSRGWVRGERAG